MKSIDWKLGMGKRISQRSANLTFKDKVLLLPLVIMLPVYTFEGVLRYYLALAGLEGLIYIPKILMLIALFFTVINDLVRERFSKGFWSISALLLVGFFIGWRHTGNVEQAAFGDWLFLQFLYGIVALPSLVKLEIRGRIFICVLWVVSIAGVWWDYLSSLPWNGFKYQVYGISTVASRKWEQVGIKRCAGFTVLSSCASFIILFFAIYLIATSKNKKWNIIIWLITGVSLAPTWAKTTIGAYLCLSIIWPFLNYKCVKQFCDWMVVTVISIGIALPCIAQKILHIDINSYFYKILLMGFNIRLIYSWPGNISRFINNGSPLLGYGPGGTGMALYYFNPSRVIPTDNTYLYLYLSFGIGMFLLLGFIVKAMFTLSGERNWQAKLFWLMGFTILLMAWTEDVPNELFLGFILGCIFRYGIEGVKWAPAMRQGAASLRPFTRPLRLKASSACIRNPNAGN